MRKVKVKLSEFFYRHEVACHCGCGRDTMDAETLRVADEVRRFEGSAIEPNSGHRCHDHNKAVGGGEDSQHLYGRAMDLPVRNPRAVYDYLCKKYPDKYGFGLYETFVHVDTKSGKPRRW